MKISEIKKLIKELKKARGKECGELNIDCPSCKFTLLISCLEWYNDLTEWGEKFDKK